jgi:hypothetical protein
MTTRTMDTAESEALRFSYGDTSLGIIEQLADFLDAQHRWQLAWVACQGQASRQIWPVERYGEEAFILTWRGQTKRYPATSRCSRSRMAANIR